MKNRAGNFFAVITIFALIVAVSACSKKPVPSQPGFGGEAPGFGQPGAGAGGMGLDDERFRALGITTEAEKREFLDKARAFENQDVYYDYDAYTLSEPAKKVLDEKIAFLKRFSKVKVTVEGHCDERGTTEYNLALGERRANAALQYIGSSGLQTQSLKSVSYGKERPVATGHDEASWAKNRRAHFVLNY
ncbi:MAG: peptidoglycan-associated lipoprotein Pal [Syntrophobacteraceae bacterium]